jgi:hypothetical protein
VIGSTTTTPPSVRGRVGWSPPSADGSVRWTFDVEETGFETLAVANGSVSAVGNDGLYALGDPARSRHSAYSE